MCGPYTGEAEHHGSYPLNHVGVSVPDLDKAVEWYVNVLGFHELRARSSSDRATNPEGGIFQIYPESLQKVRMAYLSAGNGVGFELFEFSSPKMTTDEQANFEKSYFRGGYFHIAVTTPELEATLEKIVANGGRQIGKIVPVYGHKAAYVADPWGNVVELITASFERTMANR